MYQFSTIKFIEISDLLHRHFCKKNVRKVKNKIAIREVQLKIFSYTENLTISYESVILLIELALRRDGEASSSWTFHFFDDAKQRLDEINSTVRMHQ